MMVYSSVTTYYHDKRTDLVKSDYFAFFINGMNISNIVYDEKDYGEYVSPSQDSLFEGNVPEMIYENIEDKYKYQINLIHPATIIHDGLRMINFPAFIKAMKSLIKGRVLHLYGIVFTDVSSPITSTICLATNSKWSHCGLLLRDEMNQKYLFESNGSASDVLQWHRPVRPDLDHQKPKDQLPHI